MCLALRKNSTAPYNESRIRWKMVYRSPEGSFHGPYRNQVYNKAKWNRAQLGLGITREGFHLFVSRKDCRGRVSAKNGMWGSQMYKVKRVEVRGFLRSGTFFGIRSETWKQMKFTN